MATTDTEDSKVANSISFPPHGRWIENVSYVCAGLASIGFLAVVFGLYLTPSVAATLAGASVLTLAAVIWIVAATLFILALVIRRLNFFSGKPPGPP